MDAAVKWFQECGKAKVVLLSPTAREGQQCVLTALLELSRTDAAPLALTLVVPMNPLLMAKTARHTLDIWSHAAMSKEYGAILRSTELLNEPAR